MTITPLSQQEIEAANAQSIIARAQTALAANATFQGLTAPTLAQFEAQVQLLTTEVNGLIRVVMGLLDTTAGA